MLKLDWTDEAADDLERIVDYISDFDMDAAFRLRESVLRCAERLPEYPYIYSRGRVAGTREALAHPNYILIYRVGRDVVQILGVIHARQRYP